jgi:rfaE bifunctional protein nucleotidyltransferase chain/domain
MQATKTCNKAMTKTVLAHGVFDLLHIGHIRHLEEAAELGDELVVSVTADEYVRKGLDRPYHTLKERMHALQALRCVSRVVPSNSSNAIDVINELKPAYYVKGTDYADLGDPILQREIIAAESHGGRFHATKSAKQASSSHLINFQRLPELVTHYLKQVKAAGFRDKILTAFERADQLKITFIGEVIIDEYRYVSGLGKPSKEFILATAEQSAEEFQGGIIAASRQGEFKNTTWLSGGHAIRKTRFVDQDFTRKLFEVYQRLDVGHDERFMRELADKVRTSDAIIVIDFGHGLMLRGAIDVVSHARFLAVNAQTNAGNVGFNPVTNYRKADLIVVDEPEARLATQNRTQSIISVGDHLCGMIKECDKFIITLGRNGAWAGWRAKPRARALSGDMIPAFSTRGLDTMGAGDAFLAVAAPLVATGLEVEAAAFAGAVAGAIKTTIVGHRRNVRRGELIQTIEALLA